MRIPVVSVPWRWIAVASVVAGICGLNTISQSLAADGVKSRDVTSRFEVKTSQSLLGTATDGYFAKVMVKNTSDEDQTSPLAVIVRQTGINGLRTGEPSGVLVTGEEYFTLLPVGDTLRMDETLTIKLALQTDAVLRGSDKRKFALDVQVVELIPSVDPAPQPQQAGRNLAGLPIPGQNANGGQPAAGQPAAPAAKQDAADKSDAAEEKPAKEEPKLEPKPGEENLPPPAGRQAPPPQRPTPTKEEVTRVMGVQDAVTKDLMKIQGVVGTGTGMDAEGKAVIRVYLERAGIRKNLPDTIQGVTVKSSVVGRFRPLSTPADGKQAQAGIPRYTNPDVTCTENPRIQLQRPVPIGSSIMNIRTGCAAGTLGCRVKDSSGNLFILSNNHVMADENSGIAGDLILQPGPLDAFNQCAEDTSTSIGTLSTFVTIQIDGSAPAANLVDAAIASTTDDLVAPDTGCNSYGLPRETTVAAELGLLCQKYGRTTYERFAPVSELNMTVTITYDPGPATFVNQIGFAQPVGNGLPGLGAPGDSGSLIVTRANRNPVALLFAGSSLVTIGNPIDDVLTAFDVTIDGE